MVLMSVDLPQPFRAKGGDVLAEADAEREVVESGLHAAEDGDVAEVEERGHGWRISLSVRVRT